MARMLNRLSARTVQTLATPGRHCDGGGLYLVVSPSGSRKWVFRYRWRKRLTDMGLGSASVVTLARARERALAARVQISEGINPLDAKRAVRAVPKFGVFADELVQRVQSQWKNEKHRAQVASTLKIYGAALAELPVNEIDTNNIIAALRPIWDAKPETASRVRGRIEWVLDAAKANGFRQGENPARWKGHLDQLLPKRQRLTRGHHAAMPFDDVPQFIAELRARQAIAALALEFAILTAARSGEVRGATWSEVDLDKAIWTVPALRMKAGREHRVPLSDHACAILVGLRDIAPSAERDAIVFQAGGGKPLSDAAFSALLKRMGRVTGELTPHGFRSSFRDWVGERTGFPSDVAEMCLAHAVGDMTERAYRRGDALEKRRELMAAWGDFLAAKKN